MQRPSVESQLLADVDNLMAVATAFRDNPNLPLDYYTVFRELEKQLSKEFDFVEEANSMERIYNSLVNDPVTGLSRKVPIEMPLPVKELVSRRVLVMDYLRGFPLSRAQEEMEKRGVRTDSPEAKLLSRKLVADLTKVFGRSILESKEFHADPHPGNIFVSETGHIGVRTSSWQGENCFKL